MRTEKEIKELLDSCNKVRDFGISNGPCPLEDGDIGCCAECSMPSTLRWVLGEDNKASDNSQNLLIDLLKTGDEI